MRFDVVTIFPAWIRQMTEVSILGRALQTGVIEVRAHDLRDFSTNRHRQVDDYPYGGGAGMVLCAEPFFRAVEAIEEDVAAPTHVIITSPSGRLFDHAKALDLARRPQVTLLCGHYKGIDARVGDLAQDELSVGDYVLSGGELAAMVVIDAVARLVPGVVGDYESVTEDAHFAGILGPPVYTRPASFRGHEVPEILLSGHEARIETWRRDAALSLTRERRPELYERYLSRTPQERSEHGS